MLRAKDVKSSLAAKVLVVGEDSNLQWSGTVSQCVMFADYYFREFPEDHGDRSRNVEAQSLFRHIMYLTAERYKSTEFYFTNLCCEFLPTPPKGKRVLIPEEKAAEGIRHIQKILDQNPTIEYVFVMSLQANYWLQKLGFYNSNEAFLAAAQPRNVGLNSEQPFYQPVDGKAFVAICGNIYSAKESSVKVVPILPSKDFPFSEQTAQRYDKAYIQIRKSFENISAR